MLTRKSIARTAAATAGLALVATGALAPAGAAEGKGSDRGQERAAAAQAANDERAAARADRKSERKAAKAEGSKGRSATAPHGNAYGHAEDKDAAKQSGGDADRSDVEKSNNGLGDERGNGHTPVTVCHALGNGGFVEITFDDNAFEKHLENHMKHMDDHQDYVVEEGAGCEQPAGEVEPETLGEGTSTEESTTTSVDTVTLTETREAVTEAQVLGAERFAARTGTGAEAPAVLGAEAAVAGSAAVPAAGPVAGILPQTGAAPMALAATAGLGLLGAGATLVARRRREV